MNTTFKDLPLEMVHRLIPNFFNLEGDATGLLNIGGNLGKTNFNYEASIDHAVFDKIYLGSLKSKGIIMVHFYLLNTLNQMIT